MKSPEQVAQHLQEIIANIYLRPARYGATAAEIEQAFWIYHSMWAYVTDRTDDFFGALAEVGVQVGSGNMGFDSTYRKLHPGAPPTRGLDVRAESLGNDNSIPRHARLSRAS